MLIHIHSLFPSLEHLPARPIDGLPIKEGLSVFLAQCSGCAAVDATKEDLV